MNELPSYYSREHVESELASEWCPKMSLAVWGPTDSWSNVTIDTNGRSLGFDVQGAHELLQALTLVLLHGHAKYSNEEHDAQERYWREQRVKEQAAARLRSAELASYRIPSNVKPKARLEDI